MKNMIELFTGNSIKIKEGDFKCNDELHIRTKYKFSKVYINGKQYKLYK